MNVYVCTDHAGHWPVGVCSVIAANNEEEARVLLDAELRTHNLNPETPRYSLRKINIGIPKAFVILDGDY